MDSLIQQLDQKHKDFNGSYADKAYNFSFDCAYEYLEILERQSAIKKIIETDKQKVEDKKQQIITKTPSLEVQEDLLYDTQKHSLSFCHSELHRDIYVPMARYKEFPNLPPHEVIGSAKIARHIFVDFFLLVSRFIIKLFRLCRFRIHGSPDSVFAFSRVVINIRQEKYRTYFNRLHHTLIPLILELNSKTIVSQTEINNDRIKIFVNDTRGIFRADNDLLSYPIKRKTKRMKLIKHLVNNDNCPVSELAETTNQEKETIMKEITEINRLFRKSLDVADDLILHHDTGGYSLNKKSFAVSIN